MRPSKKFIIIALISTIILIISYISTIKILKFIYPIKYKSVIFEESEKYGLSPYLIASIIKVESNFNPKALSKKNAMGLLQITESTGKWIAEKLDIKNFNSEILYVPEINIKMGCWYFDYLMKYYEGNLQLALAAYNGGQGNVNKWIKEDNIKDNGFFLKDIPFTETRYYVKKVEKTYSIYKNIYKQRKGMNIIA